jgi:hypothetical protein
MNSGRYSYNKPQRSLKYGPKFNIPREERIQHSNGEGIQCSNMSTSIQTKNVIQAVFTYMEYLYNNIAKVMQKLSTTLNV